MAELEKSLDLEITEAGAFLIAKIFTESFFYIVIPGDEDRELNFDELPELIIKAFGPSPIRALSQYYNKLINRKCKARYDFAAQIKKDDIEYRRKSLNIKIFKAEALLIANAICKSGFTIHTLSIVNGSAFETVLTPNEIAELIIKVFGPAPLNKTKQYFYKIINLRVLAV